MPMVLHYGCVKAITRTEEQKTAMDPIEPLLHERDVSLLTGRSVASLRRDRLLGGGIPYAKLGSLVRYDPHDIREYIARNKRGGEAR